MSEHRHRLAGVHPTIVAAVEAILPVMAAIGEPMWVVEGVRSAERQRELYAQGRTAPGRIVTFVDGERVRGKHQIDPEDGYGHAVDCAFQGPDPWDAAHPWPVYGALVRWRGLKWGGAFRMVDSPHMEMR